MLTPAPRLAGEGWQTLDIGYAPTDSSNAPHKVVNLK